MTTRRSFIKMQSDGCDTQKQLHKMRRHYTLVGINNNYY